MIDRNSESYKKSESQVKKMLLAQVNAQRKAKGFDPLPFPKEPKAKDFVKTSAPVKRIPKK